MRHRYPLVGLPIEHVLVVTHVCRLRRDGKLFSFHRGRSGDTAISKGVPIFLARSKLETCVRSFLSWKFGPIPIV